ncbi:MAG TPA: hypothetical protein VG757_03390 [Devosia sp.]|nr:hypothetical protein [Devosia sp.]
MNELSRRSSGLRWGLGLAGAAVLPFLAEVLLIRAGKASEIVSTYSIAYFVSTALGASGILLLPIRLRHRLAILVPYVPLIFFMLLIFALDIGCRWYRDCL